MRHLACDIIGSVNRPGPAAGVSLRARGGGSAPPRRGAFTLAELVVSIGVLALMMVMAGTVFKLTLGSTGQANALIDVSQSLRLLEQTLREDLAQTPRQGAVLVIEANPINAFWRREDSEVNPPGTNPAPPPSGELYAHEADPEREYPDGAMMLPRADVLMTFTARTGQSCLCPAVMGQVQQVVYGHAEVGELDAGGNWVGAAPGAFAEHVAASPGTIFPIPAEQWHLARRSVLIVHGTVPSADCSTDGVEHALDDSSGLPDELLDGASDIVAKGGSGTEFDYWSDVVELTTLGGGVDLADWFARSRLDLAPPARQADRLGHHFIPHCASFKVEWALDLRRLVPFTTAEPAPSSLVWFDPARGLAEAAPDPLGELDDLVARMGYTDTGILNAINTVQQDLVGVGLARFMGPPYGISAHTPVWFANDSVNPGGSMDEPDRYFPDALRITVDLYDGGRKLTRPLRHVMVLPVGR